jgi:hypothetical protein
MLTTEGLNEFQVADLHSLTQPLLMRRAIVILPRLNLSPAQADLLRQYVKTGGVLIAFRPDSKLADVFGVRKLPYSLREAWLRIDSQSPFGVGLTTKTMKFHGTADLYSLTSAVAIAKLYRTPSVATSAPAAATNAFGAGKAFLFSYDLAESIVLMRQGNPEWAGYPNNHDGHKRMRASQLFMDINTGSFWNDSGDGELNDVPQADEQLRLFSNTIVLSADRLPLPRVWYYPDNASALLLMTGDQHGDPESNSTREIQTVTAYGGLFSEFLQFPFRAIDQRTATGWLATGNAIGIHVDDTTEHDPHGELGDHLTWNGMDKTIATALNSFANAYPNVPPPLATRTHYLLWASNDASGRPDPIAQARLLQKHGIEWDSSFSAYPNRWGYMNGSCLPMKFFDTRTGEIIPVYEQGTQYEDDVQLTQKGLQWDLLRAQKHYSKTLGESVAQYNAVTVMLFHPDTWRLYQNYARLGLLYAKAHSIPMTTSARWLDFWKGRTSISLSDIRFAWGRLSFVTTGAPQGLTLLVPSVFANSVASSLRVDGSNQPFTLATHQGIQYSAFVLSSGNHQISIQYESVIPPRQGVE